MKPNETARAILSRIEYATIATVDTEGNPWNAPVYVAFDDAYTFYWGSHTESQHSKNIHANGKAFLVLYNSTMRPGTGEGVYIKVVCSEITDLATIKAVHALIQKRRHPIPYWSLEKITHPNSPIHLYQGVPEKMWLNGDTILNGTYVDIRIAATK
jgi:hypothetical protein